MYSTPLSPLSNFSRALVWIILFKYVLTQFGRVIPKSVSNWTHVASVFCLWILNAWHFNWDIFLWNEIISNIRLIKTSVSFSSFHPELLVGFPATVSCAVGRDSAPRGVWEEQREGGHIRTSGSSLLHILSSPDFTWLKSSVKCSWRQQLSSPRPKTFLLSLKSLKEQRRFLHRWCALKWSRKHFCRPASSGYMCL